MSKQRDEDLSAGTTDERAADADERAAGADERAARADERAAGADGPKPDAGPARPTREHDESIGSASRAGAPRASLGLMLRAGVRALVRYRGLVVALYLVQLVLSAGAALVMMTVLTRVFGTRPLFDRAMEGDLAALLDCLRDPAGAHALFGMICTGLGAAFLYGALSWFLTAGLIAVFLDAPSRGREVARWFGAGGASSFFAFFRLALWSLLPLLAVAVAAASGIYWMSLHLGRTLDGWGVAETLATGLGPALAVHWVIAAAIDYARIDLVRHPGLSSLRALARGFGLIVRRPLTLFHTLLYGVVFGAATAVAVWAGLGGGVAGLAALMVVRQVVNLIRFAAHVGLIAGQVELSCTTLPAPLARRS